MRDKINFAKQLTGLSEIYGKGLPEAALDLYWAALERFDDETVSGAIGRAAVECKFFPKPTEIIGLIIGPHGGGQNPEVAWEMVLRTMERVGGYSDALFQDGAMAVAINAIGGWADLCALSYEELTLQRIPARFQAVYAEAVRRGDHTHPGVVEGRITRDNSARGLLGYEGPPVPAVTLADVAKTVSRPEAPRLEGRPAPAMLPAEIATGLAALAEAKRLN